MKKMVAPWVAKYAQERLLGSMDIRGQGMNRHRRMNHSS
jgi:hypothetical protein